MSCEIDLSGTDTCRGGQQARQARKIGSCRHSWPAVNGSATKALARPGNPEAIMHYKDLRHFPDIRKIRPLVKPIEGSSFTSIGSCQTADSASGLHIGALNRADSQVGYL